MSAQYRNGNIVARCPDCNGAQTTFENGPSGYGTIIIDSVHIFEGNRFKRIFYRLMRCAGCGRGGLAKIHDNGNVTDGQLESFYPTSIERGKLPKNVPIGIESEFREAELCGSIGAWRAASGLLRSTLEKLLKENGYITGGLAGKIDAAAEDGTITEARKKRAHEDIRVLGNDVLHDEWRAITSEEVQNAHHYIQRLIEDFYDDRSSVEKILIDKGRIKAPSQAA